MTSSNSREQQQEHQLTSVPQHQSHHTNASFTYQSPQEQWRMQQQSLQQEQPLQPLYDFTGLHGLFFDRNTPLGGYCEMEQWPQVLVRLGLCPHECSIKDGDGNLALHLACRNGAPVVVLQALASSYPDVLSVCDTQDGMTPLHIACGCQDITLDKVRALLHYGPSVGQPHHCASHVQDRDGDTPLHAACRSAAPLNVIQQLIDVNPGALHVRDKEGLTPLLRLWVRAFVLFGEEELNAIESKEDLMANQELQQIWDKTHTCLVGLSYGKSTLPDSIPFYKIHHIVAYDCPRVVLRIALKLYPDTIMQSELFGGSLLAMAINRRMFQVRDLSDEGYSYLATAAAAAAQSNPSQGGEEEVACVSAKTRAEQQMEEDDLNILIQSDGSCVLVPSVIDTLLEAEPRLLDACERDEYGNDGVSPLHAALRSGKGWTDGVGAIVKLRPDSVHEKITPAGGAGGLYPFMMPAFCCPERPLTRLTTIFELMRRTPHLVAMQYQEQQDDCKPAARKRSMGTEDQDQPTKRSNNTRQQNNGNGNNKDLAEHGDGYYLTKTWSMENESNTISGGSQDDMGEDNPWWSSEENEENTDGEDSPQHLWVVQELMNQPDSEVQVGEENDGFPPNPWL